MYESLQYRCYWSLVFRGFVLGDAARRRHFDDAGTAAAELEKSSQLHMGCCLCKEQRCPTCQTMYGKNECKGRLIAFGHTNQVNSKHCIRLDLLWC
jgi:hypothetical protein